MVGTNALSRLQSTGRYALELEAVSRHFGALVALADINLTVKAGERRAGLGGEAHAVHPSRCRRPRNGGAAAHR